MIDVSSMPAINATLNATSTLLLTAGYLFIRRHHVWAHMTCMLSAFATSMLFLAGYLFYHFQVGHVEFRGAGAVRSVYFSILVSHVLLAFTVPPLALVTLYRAFRQQFDRHKAIARWTLPIWLYVSVTGVVVYWMVYKLYPNA